MPTKLQTKLYPILPAEVGLVTTANSKLYPYGDVRRYGAAGDYDPTLGTGTDDNTAIVNALTCYSTLILDLNKKYQVTSTLDFTNKTVIWNGSEIHKTGTDTGAVASCVGTVGTYRTLDSDATIGTNILTNATLASEVSQGDLVKISSTATFVASVGSLIQGEMATVWQVVGSNVYLSECLHDTYTTANGAKAAKVTPAMLESDGVVRLVSHPATASEARTGLILTYAKQPNLTVESRNAQGVGVQLNSCYKPEIHFVGSNNAKIGSTTGYGVSVNDSTMYAQIFGSASQARHGVALGGATANLGVVWECHVHGFVSSAGAVGTACFDAHGEVGSVYYHDCTALGGSWDDSTGTTNRSTGWDGTARYVYLRDCVAIRCGSGYSTRSDGAPTLIDIDGLTLIDCQNHGFTNSAAIAIGTLKIRNMRGNIAGAGVNNHAVTISGGDITNWEFDNIRVTVGGLFSSSGTGSRPAKLRLNNCSCEGNITPGNDTTNRGIQIANSNTSEVYLNNVRVEKRSYGVYHTTALTVLEFRHCDFDTNYRHHTSTATALGEVSLLGGRYRNSQNGSANIGIINTNDATNKTIDVLIVDGVSVATDLWIAGNTAVVTKAIVGAINGPSGLGIARNSGGTQPVHVMSGPSQLPWIGRGPGSPNTAVTAAKGALFERTDGSSGTLLYVNTDGATAWTAFA